MPRKDSITGCMVMTVPEFWESEAKHEGKGRHGFELMEDFYREMAEQEGRDNVEFRKPGNVLSLLMRQFTFENQGRIEDADPDFPPLPLPTAVLLIHEARTSFTMRSSSEHIRASVQTVEGQKIAYYTLSHWGGSRMEPPETEIEIGYE